MITSCAKGRVFEFYFKKMSINILITNIKLFFRKPVLEGMIEVFQ